MIIKIKYYRNFCYNKFLDEMREKKEKNIDILSKFFNSKRNENWDNKEIKDNKQQATFRLRVNTVKLFIDGVFESGTALWHKESTGNDLIIKKIYYL